MAKFREFVTSSGKLVLSGKDRESNEELIKQVEKENIVLHTKEKGSPFAEIKANEKKVSKQDIKEARVFIAKYSQDWKKNKRDVLVHYFQSKDIFKSKGMKQGTFGVKKYKEIKILRTDILRLSHSHECEINKEEIEKCR